MSTTTSPRLIKVIVFSDFVCPYNYIGHNALNTALEQCADQPLQFEIEYKPFRLNSDLPIEPPVDRAEFFGNKFGARYEPARAMFKGMADSLGLPLPDVGLVSQTTRAHRLALKAYRTGGQAMQQAVVKAYFAEGCGAGKDIGNVGMLADIAAAAGVLPRARALEFLAGDELAAEVEQLIGQARASGIKGSPVVIVDGKFKLDGVQTSDTYVQVFRRLGKCAKACAAAAATAATAATSGSPTYSETSSDGTISPPRRSTAVAV